MNATGGRVVHSYGRLIPHEFPITDLHQISGPDGIGRITCTDSSGTAVFNRRAGGQGGVTHTINESTAILVVNTNADSFNNSDINCNSDSYYFYLFLSSNRECTKQCRLYIMWICGYKLRCGEWVKPNPHCIHL